MLVEVEDVTVLAPLPLDCTQLVQLSSEVGLLATCPLSSAQLPPCWAWGSTSAESLSQAPRAHTSTELRVPKGCTATWSFSGVLLLSLLLSPFQMPTLPHSPGLHCPQLPSLKKEKCCVFSFFWQFPGPAGTIPPHPPPYPQCSCCVMNKS